MGNREIADFVGPEPAIDPELRHMLLTIAYKRPLRILIFGSIRLAFRVARALARPFRRGAAGRTA